MTPDTLIKKFLILLIISFSTVCAHGQLSKGQGETITLPTLNCSIYLPQHFKVIENGSGVIHNASSSLVTIVKIPQQKAAMISMSSFENMKEILADARMSEVQFRKMDHALRRNAGPLEQSYFMKYKLQGYNFERINVIIPRGQERYLVVANYTERYKDQVKQEIDQIIQSIQLK